MTIDTAVILAGAVARGAYEAAALSVALPKLEVDLGKTLFVGTSAGALNAALWAVGATPNVSLAGVGTSVENVWRGIDDSDVFSVGLRLPSSGAVLSTAPLRKTIGDHFKPSVVAKNLQAGSLGGLAVVATSFGASVAGARAHVFYQTTGITPQPSPSSTIDYLPATIDVNHLVASSAVPAVFPPVKISNVWYMDGGVRLHTPLAVGLAFGAKRLIVVTTHTADYPLPAAYQAGQPSGSDAVASILHNMLADGLIEDLRRLKARNATGKPGDVIVEHVVIAPQAGLLARDAMLAFAGRPGSRLNVSSRLGHDTLRKLRYQGIYHALLGSLGSGVGRDELFSYFYFEPAFFTRQLARGLADAQAAVTTGWVI